MRKRGISLLAKTWQLSLRAPGGCAAISLLVGRDCLGSVGTVQRQSGAEIVSVDCINLEMALQSQRLLRRSDAVGTPGNDERGIRLAKTVEEYVSQVSEFFCPDCSSCPVSKTFVP